MTGLPKALCDCSSSLACCLCNTIFVFHLHLQPFVISFLSPTSSSPIMSYNDSSKTDVFRQNHTHKTTDIPCSDHYLCDTARCQIDYQKLPGPFSLWPGRAKKSQINPLVHCHCHLAQHMAQRPLNDEEANAFALPAAIHYSGVAKSVIVSKALAYLYPAFRTWRI